VRIEWFFRQRLQVTILGLLGENMQVSVDSPTLFQATKPFRFEMLDGLRGIAAAVVLFSHACSSAGTVQIFEKQYLCVYFFFMLSGFVVAYAYEKKMAAGMTVLQFYLRRAIRLYPLIIAGAVLCTIFLICFRPKFVADPTRYFAVASAIAGLPFVSAKFMTGAFPVNPPEWSLFYELMAYAAYGILATRATTFRLIIVTIISFLLFALVGHIYGHDMTLTAHIATVAAPFSFGVLLWRVYQTKIFTLPPLRFWQLAIILVAPSLLPDNFDRAFDAVIVGTVFPLIILSGAAHRESNGNSYIKALGDLSYPIYILHWAFVSSAPIFLWRYTPMTAAIGGCIASVVFAWIAYTFIDLPVRKYLTARLLYDKEKISAGQIEAMQ
jgi:peptidoglycan/LPS O-acetylase OafA/YrhL